ncbi:hypothetical protein AAC387_Pa07g3638 [Persea americana]
MLLRKAQTSLTASSLSLYKNSLYLCHNTPQTQHFCNSYTHLLRSQSQTRPIQQIHARIVVEGSSCTSFSATHLVKSYAKVGSLSIAHQVFESVPEKSVFLWNAMIRACSRVELWSEIAALYGRMEDEGVDPDGFTFPFVIKACSIVLAVEDGRKIHEVVNRVGLVGNVHVATALIDMYVGFGEIGSAREVFDAMCERDVVAWTSMIAGYVGCLDYGGALRVFREMRLGDERPNSVTVLNLIPACDNQIHAFVIKSALGFSMEVETAILDMYAKKGDLASARCLFDGMQQKSLISWTAMLSGYSQNKCVHEALVLFHQMLRLSDLKPDAIASMSVLQACAQLGLLKNGEMVHGYVVKSWFGSELLVETVLVDMYAKCGNLNAAQIVFDGIQEPNIATWSAMIAAYGFHGFGLQALDLFREMNQAGLMPDETTFLSVLCACSHSGLVCEGRECFNLMVQTHELMPTAKHYACMVDLLGRAGLIDEACALIEGMPIEPDVNVWAALLSACRVRGNVRTAEKACRRLFELKADDVGYNVLLANVYASCGRWDDVSKVRSIIRRKGEGKIPGCSFVDVNCKIHTFFAGDRSHPQSSDLYAVLEMVHSFVTVDNLDLDSFNLGQA